MSETSPHLEPDFSGGQETKTALQIQDELILKYFEAYKESRSLPSHDELESEVREKYPYLSDSDIDWSTKRVLANLKIRTEPDDPQDSLMG